MAQMNQAELIAQLQEEVGQLLAQAQLLNDVDMARLSKQPEVGKWSVVQVIEHLNTYNRYYLPLVAIAIAKSPRASGVYTSGWLGDYFTKSMYSEVKDKKRVLNKMSAMKGHIPEDMPAARPALAEYIAGLQQLKCILEQGEQVQLDAVKVPITISKWIKIKTGDALRFLVAHLVRHSLQIEQTLAATSKK